MNYSLRSLFRTTAAVRCQVHRRRQRRARGAARGTPARAGRRPPPRSPTGSFRAYIFWTLSEARSRLYRSQISQLKTRRKALDEIYTSSFAPFQISVIFQYFCTIFAKFDAHFVDFQRRRQILQFFV